MGVQRVGTKLVAEGADEYIRNMDRASGTTDRFSKTLKGIGLVAAGVAVAKAFSGIVREAVGATAAYEQLQMSMTSLVAKEIRNADQTLSMTDAMGKASARAEDLLQWIQELAIKSPFSQEGVASAFRTALAYGFTSEEAQRLTAATIDFATATGQSVGVMNQVALALGQIKAKGRLAGQEILQLVNAGFAVNPILEKLGYTTEDVSKGLVSADKFLLAFTESLENDFGGAAGRSAETINGLMDSLGDLKSVGLRELFGPAIQATLPILSAFVSKIQELMPAARAAGQLLGGMVKTLADNKAAFLNAAIGVGVFFAVLNAGTIISAITGGIGLLTTALGGLVAALGVLISPIGIAAAAAALLVGGLLSLRNATAETESGIQQSAGMIGDDFENMGESIHGTAERTAEEAHGWGYNLIMQFANGMAKAMSAVIQVLINIGNAIAGWLAPGSPPRLLPDIDDWGTAAMDEFLGGFSAANFGLLQGATRPIEQFMRSAFTGDNQGTLLNNIRDMRMAMAGAVEEFRATGSVSADTFSGMDPAVRSYLSAMFEVAAADQRVAEAQSALNDITKRYNDMLKPLNDELGDIQNRRQDIIDQQREAELQAIISDENAPALAKELAAMELREIEINRQIRATEDQQAAEEEAAQAALDAALTEQQAAQERFAQQQALLDLRIEDNQLLAEQAALLDAAAGAASAAAGAMGGLAAAVGGVGASLAGAFDGLGTGLAEKANQMLEDLKAPFAGIKAQFEELKVAWAKVGIAFLERLKPVTDALYAAWGPGGTWSGNMELLKTMFGQLRERFNKKMESLKDDLRDAGDYMKGEWGEGGTWAGNMELLKTAIGLLTDKWNEHYGEEGFFRTVIGEATKYLSDQWGEGGTWAGIMNLLGGIIEGFKNRALESLISGLKSVNTWIGNVYDSLKALIDLIANTDLSKLNPLISNSPAPLAVGLSQINRQMSKFTGQQLPALRQQTAVLDMPATSSQVANNSIANYNQPYFNFGGNNVNNAMDMATLEAAVLRVVTGALP